MRRIGFAFLVLLLASTPGIAHFNMLLPNKPWADKGEKVTFTYQFGHPFEHELSDAPKPVALVVIKPKGGREILDIGKVLTPIKKDGADGKKVTAWQFDYSPAERGDYTFVLKTPPIKHDEHTYEDIVKVVLHVQTQNGWDTTDPAFDIGVNLRPYTRPYGLLPGMAFRGRVVRLPSKDEFKTDGLPIEIEKYNAKPLKNLPPDELITFKTKADSQGFFLTTLPEAGWWGMTAVTNQGQRATLWVHVDEKK